MTQVKLSRFPLPPSANALYKTLPNRVRAKSKEYKAFDEACRIWMLSNMTQVWEARNLVKQVGPMHVITIDRLYHFKWDRILCKDGTPKRNDTSNYIKALDDVVSQIIQIDDKFFWSGSYDKRWVQTDAQEGVYITLTPYHLPTL